ncbi:MAG: universal stress protein [Burkholderiaceae bacterium]
MSYATLLVHLQSGESNTALLTIAGQLAERFGAHVIGIAACQPMMIVGGDGYVCGDVFEADERKITEDLAAAQAEFHEALHHKGRSLEWRSTVVIAPLADYLAVEARSADLVVTGSKPTSTVNLARAADPAMLIMQAGRPVLIVPSKAEPIRFGHAVIGWRDTRECRRAVCDAVPMLVEMAQVTVVEIAAVDELDAAQVRVSDVVAWLERHGVMASCRVERSNGNDVGALQAMIDEVGTDVVVAGAYGHGRLREWALGGVTRDLLLDASRCVMVSH